MRRSVLAGCLLGGVVAATLGALAIAGGPTPPVLRADPEVDVVHVPAPAMATSSIDLHNDTAAPITIAALTRDPACDAEVTTTLATPAMVPANGSLPVAVSCAGTVTEGMKRCLVRATGTTGELLAELEAVCEGGASTTLAAVPGALDFGDVAIGGSAALPIALTSTGGSTVAKLFLQTTDLDNTFVIAAPCNPDARECDAAITGIMSGETTEIGVTCRPTNLGPHTAELRIASDTGAYVGAPITLTCNGTAPAGPVLAVIGDPVDAGDVEVNGTMVSPRPLRLRNAGTGVVILSGVQIIDTDKDAANAWRFTISGACTGLATPCSLGQDDVAELALQFAPTQIGSRAAVLVVSYTEAGTARSLTIPLAGTGTGATIARLGSGDLDFGSVLLAATSTLDFTLVNGGNRPATVTITPMPGGAPFLPPPASVVVQPGAPEVVPISCRPTAIGDEAATFRLTSTDASGLPIDVVARCNGMAGPLFALPSTLALGELRVGAQPIARTVEASTTGAALTIASATLANPTNLIGVDANLPSAAPTDITVTVTPLVEGVLDNELVITATNGSVVRVPITGAVASASYGASTSKPLGTFCIDRPTTPGVVTLASTGTATITLDQPVMALGTQSPFDLAPANPAVYPALLGPAATASVSVTPKRSLVAGVQVDDIVWTTDVDGATTARTSISAEFVDDGGAIAPSALSFGPTVIHLDSENAQRVTLQNCDTQTIVFDPVELPSPFRIDLGRIPASLAPNEFETFTIGFHPTRKGVVSTQMAITSPQLTEPLIIRLDGEGIIDNPTTPDAGVPATGGDEISFYGCDGCTARGPGGIASGAFPLAALLLSLGRRRRGSSSAR